MADPAAELTARVEDSFHGCADARLREVTAAAVRHLHAFVRETRPTQAEWLRAVEFLTAVGKMCDDRRQEFILLSDTLGVSMLVDLLARGPREGATDTTVLGPFHAPAPTISDGGSIAGDLPGEPTYVSGVVRDETGAPLPGATLDVWQADAGGLYDVQKPGGVAQLRGVLRADAQGRYAFRTIKPSSYPIPTDGPVGRMMAALSRHPYRPAHIHFMVSAPGFETLVTHVFVEGDRYLDSDAVFAVKRSLVRPFARREPGAQPDGRPIGAPWWSLEFDIGLVRE